MARVLATVSGTALKPGVSKNRRYYSPEAIAQAVARAQGQLADGGIALTMRSHHAAEDDSTRIVGAVRSLTLAEDGSARFTADIADTEHGRTIAALLDTSDGKPPFLSGVSIRGAWTGRVRKESGPDGSPVERGDSLALLGLDYTASPGVPGAQVDAFAWAAGGASETSERVLITESVEEARVTITEEATPSEVSEAPPPEGLREALGGLLAAAPHTLDNGVCRACAVTEASDPKKPYGDVQYADPGYQKDGQKRYPLDSPAHIRAAWSYVNQAKNAGMYTSAQLKRIKGRIKSAMMRIGAKVAAEGWVISPAVQLTEAVAEYAGMDPSCAGSYSLSATNGPTTVTVCSYGLDPADLQLILAQACKGAGLALMSLDPDMDADIDVPGADAEDTDGDMGDPAPGTALPDNGDGINSLVSRMMAAMRGESAETPENVLAEMRRRDADVAETAAGTASTEDPAPEDPAAAVNEGTEDPAVSETTTTETAATAPGSFTQADIDAAISGALERAEAARKAKKAAKKAKPAAESAPAAPVAETAADVDARVNAIVEQRLAAERSAADDEARVARLVEERLVAERQRLTEQGGGPGRKGLSPSGAVTEHSGAQPAGGGMNEHGLPADWPNKPLHQFTSDEMEQYCGPVITRHVLKDRADLLA